MLSHSLQVLAEDTIMKTLVSHIRFNRAVTTDEVRITFTSRTSDRELEALEDSHASHNDICECPGTLQNLLVVRDLLDAEIERQS